MIDHGSRRRMLPLAMALLASSALADPGLMGAFGMGYTRKPPAPKGRPKKQPRKPWNKEKRK